MAVSPIVDFRIRCDHTGCGRQIFLAADGFEHAARRAVTAFGWQGNAKRIHCPEHKAAHSG